MESIILSQLQRVKQTTCPIYYILGLRSETVSEYTYYLTILKTLKWPLLVLVLNESWRRDFYNPVC